ncbi:MAG: hypothetical protein ACI9G9_000001, partial [Psychromonas sp.]
SNAPCTASTDDVVITRTVEPTAANAGSDITSACGVTTATLAGNTPVKGTGVWSVVSGTATITTLSSPTSGVTGLVAAGTVTLLWTISNGDCTPSTDEVVITTQNCCTAPAVTFLYKGVSVTYDVVGSNAVPSRCWLDRNLGASQVATSSTDAAAYGDLFQWGRLDDKHQNRTSETTTTLSSTDTPGHDDFITKGSSPYDWRSGQNNALWQGVSGINNPCPTGYRIPTETEFTNERLSWPTTNSAEAFASPLKLTVGGFRFFSTAGLSSEGSAGVYWSSTVSGANAQYLNITSANAITSPSYRATSMSVRCIKD